MWSKVMATSKRMTTVSGSDLERVRAAIVTAEEGMARLEAEAAQAAASVPRSAAAAVLRGAEAELQSATEANHAAQKRLAEARTVLEGLRGEERDLIARDKANDVAHRWRETEVLLTVEATEAMQKIQAGCDLLIAGFRGLRSSTNKARMTIPGRVGWWPELWGNTLEGQMRRYLAARGGPFGGNIMTSDFPTILAGPDLNRLHAKAVREILGDHRANKEQAA